MIIRYDTLPKPGNYVSIHIGGICQLCLVHDGPHKPNPYYYTLLALPSQLSSRAVKLCHIPAHWVRHERLSDWQWLPPNDLDMGFWVPKGAQEIEFGTVKPTTDNNERYEYYRGIQDT